MPITKVGGVVTETPVTDKDQFDRTGVMRDDQFAVADDVDRTKQIKFSAGGQATDSAVTIAAGASSGNITITLPTTSGTLATSAGATNSFVTIQPDSGTSPTADSTTDTLTMTSSDGTVDISGDASTDTLNVKYKKMQYRTFTEIFCDFLGPFNIVYGQGDGWYQGGAEAAQNYTADQNSPGIIRLRAPTGGANTTTYVIQHAGSVRLGGGTYTWECRVRINTLATVGDDYNFHIGLNDNQGPSSGGDATDGVWFSYKRGTSANWIMNTANNNVRTATASSSAVTAGAWVTLKFVVNAAASSVEYFIDDVSAGTITTNIPSASGRETNPCIQVTRLAGSTAAINCDTDYIYWRYDFTTSR